MSVQNRRRNMETMEDNSNQLKHIQDDHHHRNKNKNDDSKNHKVDASLDDEDDAKEKAVTKQRIRASYIILALVCCINFGTMVNYDLPGSLNIDVKRSLHVQDPQMGLLFSVYTIPNCIFVMISGMMIDKYGLRICASIFLALVAFGVCVSAFACATAHSYYLMVIGRFFYGLGAESTYVCTDAILVSYFPQELLGRAMALDATFMGLAEFSVFYVTSVIHDLVGMSGTLFIGSIFACCSFIAALSFARIDKYYERMKHTIGMGDEESAIEKTHNLQATEKEVKSTGFVQMFKNAWGDMKEFDSRYWSLVATSTALCGTYITFSGFAPDLLEKRFHMTQSQASARWSIGPICNIISTPFVSLLFSRIKQTSIIAVVWATMGGVCFAHLYLAFAPRSWPVLPPLMLIGFAYNLNGTAIWPSLPLYVDEDRMGTAFGILYAASNIAYSCLYYLIGHIIHKSAAAASLVWASAAFFGFISSAWWFTETD